MSPLTTAYLALAASIATEVIGTGFLQRSEQFSRLGPTIAMVVFYVLSFYLLAISLKAVPLSIAYALWAAGSCVLVACLGVVVFGQRLDLPAIVGITLIASGVLVLNLFSTNIQH